MLMQITQVIHGEQLLVKAKDEAGAVTISDEPTEADHNTATSPTRETGDLGKTTVFASRHDPRFCYCLYVPPNYATADTPLELLVVVHDSSRSFLNYRDALAEFGRWNNVSYPPTAGPIRNCGKSPGGVITAIL